MNVQQVKKMAQEFLNASTHQYPGLRAAHLVGGITTMPEDAEFPTYKDVDMHLIFDEDSPHLIPRGPFPNILEIEYNGLMLEGGYKSVTEYQSAETVLANPEIAHHLTVDSILYDPTGLLNTLKTSVMSEYAHRRWILKRLEYEQRGLQDVRERAPVVREFFGAQGLVQMLAYSFTFATCALCIVTLNPPTTGSRTFLRMHEFLIEHKREDLYTAVMGLFNLNSKSDQSVERFLAEGIEAFDLATQIQQTPHFFQHKLKPHIKPYFVDSCHSLLHEGYPEHAMLWLMPFYVSACQVISVDGLAESQAKYAARLEAFFAELGFDSPDRANEKWNTGQVLQDEFFTLAHRIAEDNPAIVG